MRPLRRLFSVLLALAPATACGILGPDGGPREELRAAERKWSTQGIDRYEYRFRRTGCECLPEMTRPYVILVDRGNVVSATDELSGEPAPEFFDAMTVPDLFELVGDALDRKAHQFLVEYDPDYGYPTLISIDYDFQVADDEVAILTHGLLPLR